MEALRPEKPQGSLGRKIVQQANVGMSRGARKGMSRPVGTLGFNSSSSHTPGVATFSCNRGR